MLHLQSFMICTRMNIFNGTEKYPETKYLSGECINLFVEHREIAEKFRNKNRNLLK